MHFIQLFVFFFTFSLICFWLSSGVISYGFFEKIVFMLIIPCNCTCLQHQLKNLWRYPSFCIHTVYGEPYMYIRRFNTVFNLIK